MADSLIKEAISHELFEIAGKLCKIPGLKDFNIVGGTALALQIGHRKSIDIDLFLNSPDVVVDFSSILDDCRDIFKNVNVESFVEKRTLITRIENIKVDFVVQRNSKMLEEPIIIQDLRLASLKDIAAMKIMAVATTSNRIKDFVDIFYLLKQFSLETLFDLYYKKYNVDNIQAALDNLPYFYDVSHDEFEALNFLDTAPSIKEVCNTLAQEVKKYTEKIMRQA